ncbi:MAG: DUF4157 domain-containing protein [bacterium]|nr:DUF4157 domain-containing protein [bacterium]
MKEEKPGHFYKNTNNKNDRASYQKKLRTMNSSRPSPDTATADEPVLQAKANNTGLPGNLKTGLENLSGIDLSDVRVHTNSGKPEEVGAFAYTQGTDIYVAPGQEKHLPHEAAHVVQQLEGRVKPTGRVAGLPLNDSLQMEREADEMGRRALQTKPKENEDRAAANSAGRNKSDGKQRFGFKDNRSEAVGQRGELMSPQVGNQPVIQLLKSHAEQFIQRDDVDWDKKDPVTYKSVNAYVQNDAHDKGLRRGLMRAWNRSKPGKKKGAARIQHYIITQPDLEVSGGKLVSGGKRLARSDSFDLRGMDYNAELEAQQAKKKITLETKDGKTTTVPLFESSTEATRLVRGYGNAFKEKGKMWGPQFSLKLGSHHGLFDAPQGNDVVFIPLEQGENGNYFREGNIFNWSTHAKDLKKTTGDKKKFKKELLQTLVGDFEPNSKELLSTAGSMMCDSKTSMRGYQEYLEEFKMSEETDPAKLFSSKPGDKPIWGPSVKEGRKYPAEKRVELEGAYRNEINALPLLFQNNCLINAVCLAAHDRKATIEELVSIRLETDTLGEMLAASPKIINSIRRILNVLNPIKILYPTSLFILDEDHHGTGDQITVYHDGFNHFTHDKPDGIIYSK